MDEHDALQCRLTALLDQERETAREMARIHIRLGALAAGFTLAALDDARIDECLRVAQGHRTPRGLHGAAVVAEWVMFYGAPLGGAA